MSLGVAMKFLIRYRPFTSIPPPIRGIFNFLGVLPCLNEIQMVRVRGSTRNHHRLGHPRRTNSHRDLTVCDSLKLWSLHTDESRDSSASSVSPPLDLELSRGIFYGKDFILFFFHIVAAVFFLQKFLG
ncbi:uncharacterized protein G2W53_021135 [Senna tora]|uniref:Uncharacterized protein n=1 Tax=Senna tora TaxID=362788 RepID=A0A834TL14_9FABA|nr:uncharacterized protein G2W53_021135 [Senna tora]